MIIFEFLIAIVISILDWIFGTEAETARYIAESNVIMNQQNAVCYQVAQATNEIWEQSAVRTSLLAEQEKNNNLRLYQKIKEERIQILSNQKY